MIDRDHLRELYDRLSDDELERLWQTDLVAEARTILQAEMAGRGIALPAPKAAALPETGARFSLRNPYLPPAALLADVTAEAAITARGLVRLFQWMVIVSTVLGIFLFAWPYLGLPIAEDMLALRFANLGGWWPEAAAAVYWILQPLWIVAAIGLYFFMWWGRWLFVLCYVLSTIINLMSGVAIWFSWEVTVIIGATLLDGSVLTLAFLPPLSRYFGR